MKPFLSRSDLFCDEDASSAPIPGLRYVADNIDPAQERKLLSLIDAAPWQEELKRRVQHYGYRYDYKSRSVTHALKLGGLPEWLMQYCEELYARGLFTKTPDQVIVNEYLPGQGISAHIDCIPCFGNTIASLSLGSPCMMEFTRKGTREKVQVLLEPRSLLVLSGEARYHWRHSILARKTDACAGAAFSRGRRVSLTFRMVTLN